jgi:hypothetical protein
LNHHPDGTIDACEIASVDLLGDAAHAPAQNIRLARQLAVAGILGVGIATVAIGLLHVMPGSRVLNPLSSTVSEYALLPDGWIFDSGVILLAVSSALILVAMMVRELVAWRSWGALMTLVWCVGLVGLIVFPKQGFGIDPSVAGRVHWTWTLIAFFSLPIGINLICWQHRTLPGRWRRWAVRLSMVAGGWFAVLTVQTAISALTPIEAWRVVGLVERALSLTEMIAVAVLGLWVLHDSGPDLVLVNTTRSEHPKSDP